MCLFTGTRVTGEAAKDTCLDWSTQSGSENGKIGSTTDQTSKWIADNDRKDKGACDRRNHIYCISQVSLKDKKILQNEFLNFYSFLCICKAKNCMVFVSFRK